MNDMKPVKHRPPDAALLERLKSVVGPKGWLDQPADLAPHLADWRRRFQGKTPLLLKGFGWRAQDLELSRTDADPAHKTVSAGAKAFRREAGGVTNRQAQWSCALARPV